MKRLFTWGAVTMLALGILNPMGAFALSGTLPSEWLRDLKKGAEEAKSSGKRILAVFSGGRCPPCQQMVKSVYPQKEVREALKDWVPVYMEYEEVPSVYDKYDVSAFPTFVMFSPDFKEEDRTVGGRSAEDFIKLLNNHAKTVAQMKDLSERVAKDPKDAKAWSELGQLYIEKDKFPEAIDAFEKAVKNDPEDKFEVADDLYFYKAVPQSADELAGAEPKLAAFQEKFPKSQLLPKAMLFRAMILFDTHADEETQKLDFGKVNTAIGLLKTGIEKYPSSDVAPQMRQALRKYETYAKEYGPGDEQKDHQPEKKADVK